MDREEDQLFVNPDFISVCCGASPIGEIEENVCGKIVIYSAICSDCLDFSNFERNIEDER